MRRLSIEQALVWAYRDQMVHVALPPGMPVEASQGYSPGISEQAFMAEKIDSGVKVGFAAAPDAYVIHQQVQRLQPLVMARTAEEMEMMFARRLLRNDFDSMDRRSVGDASRPSPTVHMLPRALVQQHAMDANQPDRCDQPAVIFERGKRVYTDRAGHIVSHPTRFGFHMLEAIGDDPLEVIALRRKYAVWHGALIYLREALADVLTSHRLTDDLPPAAMAI